MGRILLQSQLDNLEEPTEGTQIGIDQELDAILAGMLFKSKALSSIHLVFAVSVLMLAAVLNLHKPEFDAADTRLIHRLK